MVPVTLISRSQKSLKHIVPVQTSQPPKTTHSPLCLFPLLYPFPKLTEHSGYNTTYDPMEESVFHWIEWLWLPMQLALCL
jgi:hypothetical protein